MRRDRLMRLKLYKLEGIEDTSVVLPKEILMTDVETEAGGQFKHLNKRQGNGMNME